MKEINLGAIITAKRKEKKITQDQLASYLGVSKAAISKWETAQSYPDITLLPHLATYFNISVDELIGYEPQMNAEEIKKLYHKLSKEFAKEKFDTVYERCKQVVRNYYSCYPLLLQIGILILNHSMLAGSPESMQQVIEENKELFSRIKTNSEDVHIAKQALFLEAYCCLMQNDPQEALVLLEGTDGIEFSSGNLFARAYYMMGNIPKAREKTQMEVYNNIVELYNALSLMFTLYTDNIEMLDECVKRAMELDKVFQVRRFHPSLVMTVLISAAATYTEINQMEKALDLLEEYAKLAVSGVFPFRLKGDEFFDMVEQVLENYDLGTEMVRSDETVRVSIIQSVSENPIFAKYYDETRFKKIVRLLEKELH